METMSNYLGGAAKALYDGVTSIPSSIRSNPKMTVGLPVITLAGAISGMAASALTGGRAQLNNIVPEALRSALESGGQKIGWTIGSISHIAGRITGIDRRVISQLVVTPIVEELVFRLPLVIASQGIDLLSSDFIHSPLFESVSDLTGGQAIKVALAVISAIGFTYAHHKDPSAGRSAAVFSSALGLTHIAHQGPGGVGNAMIAHSIENIIPVLTGYRTEGRDDQQQQPPQVNNTPDLLDDVD